MVLTTQHCPCGAYLLATFHNGSLATVTLNHYHRRPCHGQTDQLDPNHYWEPVIPTALADRRTPGADLSRDHMLKYDDPLEGVPTRRQRTRKKPDHRLARR